MTNADLEKMVNTSDDWIQTRTGIKTRHIAAKDESTSDMALQASLRAIDAAGINKDDIGLIVLATSTPDQIFPSTACFLQNHLEIRNHCPAFDIQAVCAGFVYAISVADNFMKSGKIKHALIVGSENFSKILDWNDRTTCVLFGDGAGAIVLEAADKPGVINSVLHADGSYNQMLQVPYGVSKPEDDPFIRMQGKEVFKFAVQAMDKIVDETLQSTGIKKEDINWLIPHQANQRIINATAEKLQLPMSKVIMTVQDHGNTSAASIPLALDVGVRDGRIKQGEILLFEAIGGGFAWGANLLRY